MKEHPTAVFMGGDLLPLGAVPSASVETGHKSFIFDFLASEIQDLHARLKSSYPRIFVILGNDDPRYYEKSVLEVAGHRLWEYVHMKLISFAGFDIYGYAYIPPSPYQLKDWERYDVSRYVDPGCVSPEEGIHTVTVSKSELKHATIAKDLVQLAGNKDLRTAVFLFHAPPYRTKLDRAELDDIKVDHVPVDVHIGSIAIREFIEERQPMLTLHGHAHDSSRLTGSWRDRIGSTYMFNAAHEGPELALVRFDLRELQKATRELL